MKKILITLLILALCVITKAKAQNTENSAPTIVWAEGGLGVTSVNGAISAELNMKLDAKSLFTVRYLKTAGPDLTVAMGPQNTSSTQSDNALSQPESIKEIAFMYGKSKEYGSLFISVSGGVSFVSGETRGDVITCKDTYLSTYAMNPYSGYGVTLEGKALYVKNKYLAYGFNVIADFNKAEPMIGAMFTLGIGMM